MTTSMQAFLALLLQNPSASGKGYDSIALGALSVATVAAGSGVAHPLRNSYRWWRCLR